MAFTPFPEEQAHGLDAATMNTDEAPLHPAQMTDDEATGRPPATGRALAALALLVALAALAGSGWLWWSDFRARDLDTARQAADAGRAGQLEAAVNNRLQEIESRLGERSASGGDDRVGQLGSQVQRLAAEVREVAAAQPETAAWSRSLQGFLEGTNARLAGFEARLETLAARGLDSDAELDLAELDYLLRLAQERLQLFGDIRTADRALELADAHVAAFDNPLFSGLRREITAARRALALVDRPDPALLDRELDAVQARLATLPFRGSESLASQGEPVDGGGWWARLGTALSGLVTVRRTAEEADGLPALADQELIRQRAWLEVERIRLAAMRHDAAGFAAALQRARDTIGRWFEPRDRGTRAALQSLESAAALDVDPELPDISAPWTALRSLRATGSADLKIEAAPPQADPVSPAPEPSAPASGEEPAGETERSPGDAGENAFEGDATR